MSEINLTDKYKLRKFIKIEQYRREVEKDPKGIIGFIVRLFRGSKAYSNDPKDYNFEDAMQMEMGTEIPLRRSEWGEHRVMIVEQRVRILEMIGVRAKTKNKFETVILDMSIGFQVINPELVARQVVDPLRLFSEYVEQIAKDYIAKYELDYLNEGGLVKELLQIDEYKVSGIKLISVKATINYPDEILNTARRIEEAKNRAQAMKMELESEHEIEKHSIILEKNIEDLKVSRDFERVINELRNKQKENSVAHAIERDTALEKVRLDNEVEKENLNAKLGNLSVTSGIRKEELLIDKQEHDYKLMTDREIREHERKEEEKDNLNRLEMRDADFTKIQKMLERAGIPRQFAILASDDDSFKNIRAFLQGILNSDQNHKSKVLTSLSDMLRQVLDKSPTDEAIQIIVGRIDEMYSQLGGQPSSMDVIMATLANIDKGKTFFFDNTKQISESQTTINEMPKNNEDIEDISPIEVEEQEIEKKGKNLGNIRNSAEDRIPNFDDIEN